MPEPSTPSQAPGPATPEETKAPRRDRSYGPAVLLGLAGAGLAAVAGSRDWATSRGDAAGIRVEASVSGSESQPLVAALALVALASWGVLLVARGWVRRVLAVVGLLASAGALVAVVLGFSAAQDDAVAAAMAQGATGDTFVTSLSAWYYLAGVGALLSRPRSGWPPFARPGGRRWAASTTPPPPGPSVRPPTRTCGGRSTRDATRPPRMGGPTASRAAAHGAHRERPPPASPSVKENHGMAHHGNTPAAWTGVTIILIGFVVGGIGLVVANMLLFWVGVALLPVGAIVGKVMQLLGLGAETAGH